MENFTEEQIQKIENLYVNECKSAKTIAKELGVPSIMNIINRYSLYYKRFYKNINEVDQSQRSRDWCEKNKQRMKVRKDNSEKSIDSLKTENKKTNIDVLKSSGKRKKKRTAREIKVPSKLLSNKNVSVKIGTSQKKTEPETIYIITTFWLKPKQEYIVKGEEYIRYVLNKELQEIYTKKLRPVLTQHPLFPMEKENIYIKHVPLNINYNSRPNFVSIELHLHTKNLLIKEPENKLPLCHKHDKTLFNEVLKISNMIVDSDVLSNKSIFEIYKTS